MVKLLDIISNQLKKGCPKGLACEVASSKIFFNLTYKKLKKDEKEHIFNFFYKNKKNYNIFNLSNKLYSKNYRLNLSIDKPGDLKRIRKIFSKYSNIYVPTKRILTELRNEI